MTNVGRTAAKHLVGGEIGSGGIGSGGIAHTGNDRGHARTSATGGTSGQQRLGSSARDERLPYRIPRQPNIPSAERSGVEASVMEASPTQECQRTRSYLSHESNHPSTAIPEQQRSLAWRHSTRATCRSRTEVELGLEAPRCLQYQIYRVCRCRRPRSTRRRIDTSRCMEAWVGSRCSNSRGYAYQDMHVHQLHVEVITLSQFHICMSHV